MNNDWQPGDLALCVRGGRLPANVSDTQWPTAGRIYAVAWAGLHSFSDGSIKLGLVLPEAPPNVGKNHIWAALRFRKINPHTPDAEDAETIRLLTGKPARERVS